jgi:cyanophycinase
MGRFIFLLLATIGFSMFAQSQGSIDSKGKLIIIGGGEIPDTIFTLFAQACGGKDQPVIVIPTATEDEAWIKAGGHLKKFSDRGFTNLFTIHTREKAKADDAAYLLAMRSAKGVFFGGGDQDLLSKAYEGTVLHRAMFDLLERGGVIMGTSAGATIMGSVLIGGDHRATPQKPQSFPKGLSFMDRTAIDQHVLARNRQFDLLPVLERDTTLFGMAIDESTAAIVEKGVIRAVGKSYVLIYDRWHWQQQTKELGRVYVPFRMMSSGGSYNLGKHEMLRRPPAE